MKTVTITAIASAAALLALGGCKEKKHTDTDIIAERYVPQRLQDPIAMGAETLTSDVAWMGKPYSVTVSRTPVDSAMVSDDNGQKYIDNCCRITVKRQDGSLFAEKTFFKSSFRSYIKEPFVSRGILAGIRFDEPQGAKLRFSVVVAMPDAVDDLFLPLILDMDGQGGIAISQDDDMGMRDYEDSDDA